MIEGLEKPFEHLLEAKLTYFKLEHDYVWHIWKKASSQGEASRILQREQSGLRRKVEKFNRKSLYRPRLEPDYKAICKKEVGLDELMLEYTLIVFEDSEKEIKRASNRLGVSRATVSRLVRQGLKGENSKDTRFMREKIGRLYGSKLDDIKENYIRIALDMTGGNINRAAKVIGLSWKHIKKQQDTARFVPKRYAEVLEECFEEGITYQEIEKWYVVFLAKETAKLTGTSPLNLVKMMNKYVGKRHRLR